VAEEALRITKVGDQPGLIIAGEVDESGYPLLLQSLAALDHQGDLHIDLGGIEFCDLAGLRAIAWAGRLNENARPDRRVCLHAVPPQLRKIMHILGWDNRPGLAFDAEPLSSDCQPRGQSPRGAHPGSERASAPLGADQSSTNSARLAEESAGVRSPRAENQTDGRAARFMPGGPGRAVAAPRAPWRR
jgi:anti-anti-sigma regulatory factor